MSNATKGYRVFWAHSGEQGVHWETALEASAYAPEFWGEVKDVSGPEEAIERVRAEGLDVGDWHADGGTIHVVPTFLFERDRATLSELGIGVYDLRNGLAYLGDEKGGAYDPVPVEAVEKAVDEVLFVDRFRPDEVDPEKGTTSTLALRFTRFHDELAAAIDEGKTWNEVEGMEGRVRWTRDADAEWPDGYRLQTWHAPTREWREVENLSSVRWFAYGHRVGLTEAGREDDR